MIPLKLQWSGILCHTDKSSFIISLDDILYEQSNLPFWIIEVTNSAEFSLTL